MEKFIPKIVRFKNGAIGAEFKKQQVAPRGLPAKIWFVIWPNGERNFLHKEPIEGMPAWAKGVDATIVEYGFMAVTHTPPPKKTK